MADEYRKVLIAPDGREVTARSPREANDLMYGSGYREKEGIIARPLKPADNEATKPPGGETR